MKKKIGIIGGLSPESTVSYYLYITRTYVERVGDYSYPDIIIYSVNLEDYHRWRSQNRWDLVANDLIDTVKKLKAAGADFGLIATNTMHKVFDAVADAVEFPLINLIDEVAKKAEGLELHTLGLLGTRYTMSDGFYQERLSRSRLETVVPSPDNQEIIYRIIVNELIRGHFSKVSKKIYVDIINELVDMGAQGIILGCTEIPLLIKQEDVSVPILDTAVIHAEAALDFAMNKAVNVTVI